LPEDGIITVKAGYPPEDELDKADLAPQTGHGAMTARPGAAPIRCAAPSACSFRCEPGRGPIGVIGIDERQDRPLLTPDQRRLLMPLVDQGALAIERVQLVEDMDRVKRTVESDACARRC
jgi:two-component system sensor histidine kinase KdpD